MWRALLTLSALPPLVKKNLNDHRRVIFNGNGYSEAWEAEAARRGLPNRKCTPDAMVALKEEKNISLMEEFGVLTKTEMLSRYEVEMEHYSKIINIEARTMLKIASQAADSCRHQLYGRSCQHRRSQDRCCGRHLHQVRSKAVDCTFQIH